MQPLYRENRPIWDHSTLNVSILTGLLKYTKGIECSKNVNGWEVIGERTLLHTTCTKAFAQAFTHNETESVICFWQETPVETLFNKSKFKVDTYLPSQEVIDNFVEKIIENLKRPIHAVGYDLGGTIAQVVGCRYGFPSLSLDGPGIQQLPLGRIKPEEKVKNIYKTMIVMPHVINQIDLPENSLLFFRHSKLFTINYKRIEDCLTCILKGFNDVPSEEQLIQYASYLAMHTGRFHGFSIFETGQIDESLVEKMTELGKKIKILSYSKKRAKKGVKHMVAGASFMTSLTPLMPNSLGKGVPQNIAQLISFMSQPLMKIAQNIFTQGLNEEIIAFNTPDVPFLFAQLRCLTKDIYLKRRIENDEFGIEESRSSKQEGE